MPSVLTPSCYCMFWPIKTPSQQYASSKESLSSIFLIRRLTNRVFYIHIINNIKTQQWGGHQMMIRELNKILKY